MRLKGKAEFIYRIGVIELRASLRIPTGGGDESEPSVVGRKDE
jgi:hypothetical protein